MITSAPSTQIRAALGDQSQDQEEADAMELRQIDTDQLIERIRSMNHIYRLVYRGISGEQFHGKSAS